ncbi:MAG: hypothetical protein JWQ38_122 [Flavipsychrobacter sp.]|nr:hypothetical protein [Flavipsychrobacter sp.]
MVKPLGNIASVYSRLFIVGVLFFFSGSMAFAQGDLLISPLRIVFEGPKKSEEINLANVGKDTASYVISIKDFRMTENGGFEEITEPDSGQNFAGKYLRFFPRRVTLAPNEAQVVKLQLIKTSELADGEYRSHLYFRSVPDERALGESAKKKDTGGVNVSLIPIFGITTPVIIRIGENTAQVKLTNVSFEKATGPTVAPKLNFTFIRTGNMSVYGDMKIDYISLAGKVTQAKLIKGIGVYTPNTIRHMSVELDTDNNIVYSKGKLHITYTLQTADKSLKTVESEIGLN